MTLEKDRPPSAVSESPPGGTVARSIAALVAECFAENVDDYARELKEASDLSGISFANIRPVFLNGNPDEVRPRKYLLFVGLNPKLDRRRTQNTSHYADLNRNAEGNVLRTLRYFESMTTLHPYFLAPAKIVAAFLDARGEARPGMATHQMLRFNSIFCEAVPFHSEKTPTDAFRRLERLANVRRARAVFQMLLRDHSPAAVVLDGVATHELLPALMPAPVRLKSTTDKLRQRSCTVSRDRHEGMPVLRCNFIRSLGGPNSYEQLAEVGRLLADTCVERLS
jgi:hypothetical protein